MTGNRDVPIGDDVTARYREVIGSLGGLLWFASTFVYVFGPPVTDPATAGLLYGGITFLAGIGVGYARGARGGRRE